MLGLLLLAVLTYAGLAVGLAIAAAWTQTAYYERQVQHIPARAAIAAGVLTLFLAIWTLIEYRWPGRFGSAFTVSPYAVTELDEFWSERASAPGLTESRYRRRVVPPGRVEYVDDDGRRWQRSDSGVVTAIIIEEDGERRRFAARLDPDGQFRRDPQDPNRTLPVEYVEQGGRGRVMTESNVGTLRSPRYGNMFLNLVFNLIHLAIWVAVLAVAFELQWPHAFWLGLAGWALTLLVVWPAWQSGITALQNT